MLHERRGNLDDKLDFLLNYGVVMLDVVVLVLAVVVQELDEHVRELARALPLLDELPDVGELVLK
ncbi:hypothetical protein D3C81_2188420 [compost metagenome]